MRPLSSSSRRCPPVGNGRPFVEQAETAVLDGFSTVPFTNELFYSFRSVLPGPI